MVKTGGIGGEKGARPGQWVPAGLALVAGPDGLSLVEIAVFVLGAQAEPAQYATAKALTPAEIFSRSAVTLN